MPENLDQLVLSSQKIIEEAKGMLVACCRKDKKVFSYPRVVVSFFLRRSLELFESLLVLISENRIIDSALLLRSILELGISLGYIFAAGEHETENKKRALKYLLDGDRQQLKMININLEGFKTFDKNIETRRDEIKKQIGEMEATFRKEYQDERWDLPNIEERAKQSKSQVLVDIYNQSYRDLSNIEHHNYLFGRHYVDEEKCEPLLEVDQLKHYAQLRPEATLYFFRMIFIEILSVFNDVFLLGREAQIKDIRLLQEREYDLLKEKEPKP